MTEIDLSKTKLIDRSSGRGFLIGAVVAAVVAALTLFIGLQVRVEAYGQPDYAGLVNRWWWLTASSAAAGISVLAFGVGNIIRAIWFLPGENEKRIIKLLPDRQSQNFYPSENTK